MTQNEKYTIEPVGAVKGGDASYTADLEGGAIAYSAAIKVGYWPAIVSKQVSGSLTVDPKLLKSSAIQNVGDTVKIDVVNFTCSKIFQGTATVNMTVDGQDMYGTAQLDITGEYLKVIGLQAQAKVSVFNLNIQLVRAS